MIRIASLSKTFHEKKVLNQISLEVNDGEIAFLLGKSGVGKSVLLKNMVGLMRPDSGEIWIDGKEVSRFEESQYQVLRRSCGLIFQSPALFDSLTIFENVAFGLRCGPEPLPESLIKSRVEQVLRQVKLSKQIEKKLPQEISFGLQKRVSVARTLAIQPKYLLFDEPTTGLDPVATRAVNEVIVSLSRTLKVTSLLVSHDMKSALEIADRLYFIDQGNIVAQGTPAQMKQSEVPLVKQFLEGVSR